MQGHFIGLFLGQQPELQFLLRFNKPAHCENAQRNRKQQQSGQKFIELPVFMLRCKYNNLFKSIESVGSAQCDQIEYYDNRKVSMWRIFLFGGKFSEFQRLLPMVR